MELPGVEIFDQTVIVMGYDPVLLKAFEGEDGILGGAIWENFVVKIDFDKKEAVFIEPKEFTYTGSGEEFPLGFLFDGGSTLSGTMTLMDGTDISALVHIDLGSPVPLSINLDTHPDLTMPEKTIERRAFGSRGEFVEHVGRIRFLKLGRFIMNDVLTSFTSTPSLSGMGNEGALGSGIFQRFYVTFDYTDDKIYLEPNRHFNDPFEFDMSGLGFLKNDEGDYIIKRIIPDSQASAVDLQIDDILVKINGLSSKEISRNDLDRILKHEGEILDLVILRNKQKKKVSLKLRRLI